MMDFPTLSYTLTCEIPRLYKPERDKSTPFRRSLLFLVIIGSTLPQAHTMQLSSLSFVVIIHGFIAILETLLHVFDHETNFTAGMLNK